MTGAAVLFFALAYALGVGCIAFGIRDRDYLQIACGLFIACVLTWSVVA